MPVTKKWTFGFLIASIVTLAALSVHPQLAAAYFEMNFTGRLTTPANSGCIALSSGLQHGGGSHAMTLRAEAWTAGRYATSVPQAPNGMLCQEQTGVQRYIGGTLLVSLIKLNRASTTNAPDDYSYCRIVSTGKKDLSTAHLVIDQPYSTPPCGPGYYAEIACLQSVTTAITGEFFPIVGNFDATNFRRDCNISPNWHPAFGDGTHSTDMGSVVKP